VLWVDNPSVVRLETVDNCETGKKIEDIGGVTIKRRRFGRGLEEVALLVAFLAKVSTKFDLRDRATADKVPCRHRLQSVGKDETICSVARVERSNLRLTTHESMMTIQQRQMEFWHRHQAATMGKIDS
jgi:hypothetical protein